MDSRLLGGSRLRLKTPRVPKSHLGEPFGLVEWETTRKAASLGGHVETGPNRLWNHWKGQVLLRFLYTENMAGKGTVYLT